jgi:hypothetical protein
MAFADMPLYLDMTGAQVMVSGLAEAKKDQNGVQRTEKETGRLMWTTQLFVQRPDKGYAIMVTTAGEKPDVPMGTYVTAVELEALPWNANGKNGTAYRAAALKPIAS